MRHLLGILVVLAVLGAVVPGCGGGRERAYDGRLAAADSLLRDEPDSALAIITALPTDSLATEHDRAYRDLLLTQARYRAYVTATSDSDINRAVAYFAACRPIDREKLTRAYIYKGAVEEEMGNVDSAMIYYITAESTADEMDYKNLGQINTRIGSLFRTHYADKLTCYKRYNKALGYYRLTNNKRLQYNCLYNMAGCLGVAGVKQAVNHIEKARRIALELNDSAKIYDCLELLCRLQSRQDSTRSDAMRTARICLRDYKTYVNSDLMLDLADIYIKNNQIDSAKYYISFVNEYFDSAKSDQLKVTKFAILSDIAAKEGDVYKSKYYSDISNYIADSIDNNKQKYQIQQIENQNTQSQNQESKKKIINLQYWVVILVALLFLLLALWPGIYFLKLIRLRSAIKEIEKMRIEMVDKHVELTDKIGEKNSVIDLFVRNMVSFMQTAIESAEHDSPSVMRKKVKNCIISVETDVFWDELRTYLDNHYNNVITKIAQNPKITSQDLKFIELSCCGFNYVEIAIALEYSPNYISNKRKSIAKKMGIKLPLQDYLDRLMTNR